MGKTFLKHTLLLSICCICVQKEKFVLQIYEDFFFGVVKREQVRFLPQNVDVLRISCRIFRIKGTYALYLKIILFLMTLWGRGERWSFLGWPQFGSIQTRLGLCIAIQTNHMDSAYFWKAATLGNIRLQWNRRQCY